MGRTGKEPGTPSSVGEGCKASGARLLTSSGCFSWVEMFSRTSEPAAAAFAHRPLKGTAHSPVPSSRDARSGSSHACARGVGPAAGRKSEPGQLKIDCLSEFSMRPLRLLISPALFWRGTSCRWSSLHEQRSLGHPKASCCLGQDMRPLSCRITAAAGCTAASRLAGLIGWK